ARLATMFLIAGEVMFFAGLISAYFVLRMGAAQWPPPLQPRLPVLVTGLNTLVLLGSSFAMLRTQRDRSRARVVRGLTVTAPFGDQTYNWPYLVLILVPFAAAAVIAGVMMRVTGTRFSDLRPWLTSIVRPAAHPEASREETT